MNSARMQGVRPRQKMSCASKVSIRNVKRQLMEREEVSANHSSHKSLINFQQKDKQLHLKSGKGFEQIFLWRRRLNGQQRRDKRLITVSHQGNASQDHSH